MHKVNGLESWPCSGGPGKMGWIVTAANQLQSLSSYSYSRSWQLLEYNSWLREIHPSMDFSCLTCLLQLRAGHRWMEIQVVQQELAEFPSIYGQAGCTEVDLFFKKFLCDLLLLVIAGSSNPCILMEGETTCCQWEDRTPLSKDVTFVSCIVLKFTILNVTFI